MAVKKKEWGRMVVELEWLKRIKKVAKNRKQSAFQYLKEVEEAITRK